MKTKKIQIIILALAAVVNAADLSEYVDVDTSKYSARDITTTATVNDFTVYDGTLHYWNTTDGYYTTDIATGSTTLIGKPDDGVISNGMGDAFGIYSPEMNKFYACTINGMSDAYVYEYDHADGKWQNSYTSAVNAYGADVVGDQLYFSGLNEPWDGGYGQENYIYRYIPGTTATNGDGVGMHDTLVRTLGNSASMTVDRSGNVYYATYDFGSSALYKWDASSIGSVLDDIESGAADNILTLDDAVLLSDLSNGANGITVDDGGNVFVTYNDFMSGSSEVIMWNETMGIGSGVNYEVIATLDATQGFGWFGGLDIDGNFLEGDSLYGTFGFNAGISEISTVVPEPATLAVMALGGLLITRKRKAG